MHDFNIDDRAALLWRKPWTDGMARELTSGDNRSVDELREAVERMILTKRDKNPKVVAKQHPAHADQGTVRIDVDEDNEEAILKDIKKNREFYEADD